MLRQTAVGLGRSKSYARRNPHLPANEFKPRYRAATKPQRRSALANKEDPLDFKDTHDQRVGIDWYHRIRGRGLYAHWPWVRMSDDPVRLHKDPDAAPSRSLSALEDKPQNGVPLWDYYCETGRDYATANVCPAHYMAPLIALFAGTTWSEATIEAMLKLLEPQWPTIGDVANNIDAVNAWNEVSGALPYGLLRHIELCSVDIVLQNDRKAFRTERHDASELRTLDMERYYAMPYTQGPAVPTTLKQPEGVYPVGRYSSMNGGTVRAHPLQAPPKYKDGDYHPY